MKLLISAIERTWFYVLASFGYLAAAWGALLVFVLSPELNSGTAGIRYDILEDERLPLDFAIGGIFVAAMLLLIAEYKERSFRRSKAPLGKSRPILVERSLFLVVSVSASIVVGLLFGHSTDLEWSPYVAGASMLGGLAIFTLAVAPTGRARMFGLIPILMMAALSTGELVENQYAVPSHYLQPAPEHQVTF